MFPDEQVNNLKKGEKEEPESCPMLSLLCNRIVFLNFLIEKHHNGKTQGFCQSILTSVCGDQVSDVQSKFIITESESCSHVFSVSFCFRFVKITQSPGKNVVVPVLHTK